MVGVVDVRTIPPKNLVGLGVIQTTQGAEVEIGNLIVHLRLVHCLFLGSEYSKICGESIGNFAQVLITILNKSLDASPKFLKVKKEVFTSGMITKTLSVNVVAIIAQLILGRFSPEPVGVFLCHAWSIARHLELSSSQVWLDFSHGIALKHLLSAWGNRS